MNNILFIRTILITSLLLILACDHQSPYSNNSLADSTNPEFEKKAILDILNGETAAAFNRNYDAWKDHWVHADYVTKSYINFSDSTMTETLGWDEINNFVKTYIESHPEPDPLPTPLSEIDVRLYQNGAWVSYEQNDPNRGLKRETRLMEKVNGQWKIAGMHTTIYGSTKKN